MKDIHGDLVEVWFKLVWHLNLPNWELNEANQIPIIIKEPLIIKLFAPKPLHIVVSNHEDIEISFPFLAWGAPP